MTRSLGAFDSATTAIPVQGEGRRLTPAEGWTTFIALLVMLLAAAFAVDAANWAGYVPGTDARQTSFLPVAVFLAAVVGLLLAKTRLPTIPAHFVGAAVGAFYLVVAASGAVSTAPDIQQRLRDLSESVATFLTDVLGLGIRSGETSVFLLILGALLWSAGQFAAFAVFRRRRALPAIGISMAILLLNMTITVDNQYVYLVVLTTAALWLLVRLNLLQQVEGWRARRIGDGGYVSDLFLRSGALFVALSLVASLTLAANASSAPLQRAWRDVDDQLLEFGYEVNRWMGGVSGPARGPSNLFAPTQTIRDVWESSTELVFTATTSDGRPHYWRGATYDAFDGRTWQQTDRQAHVVPAGEALLAGTYEPIQSEDGGRREVVATVKAADMAGDMVVAPEAPYAVVDRAVEVITHEAGGNFVGAKISDGLGSGEMFTVASRVRKGAGEDGAVTANQLAAAGVDYPEWARRYIEIDEGSIGARVVTEANRIVLRLPPAKRDPYHIAEAIQNYLYRDGGFNYVTDVRGLCAGEMLVDCFLRVRRGYCEYFATAMVMMLRTQQIPARYTLGYLPGQLADGVWNVDRSAAHSWVEVYFPGYGWIRFDPTPGNRQNGQTPSRFEAGAPVATPRDREEPRQTPSFDRERELDPDEDEPVEGRAQTETPTPGAGAGGDLFGPLALAGLLLALLVGLVVAARRRLPTMEPDLAYRGVARIATRFGHGPRPTQTAYEFADGLGQLVPAVGPDLRVVATAKVEATYGRRQPDGDALRALRDAYRRVRLGLLRLLLRRPSLPRRPRST
ncbi:MAG TPA: transglutaminaseTgpA domain-containing protein [Candidatus Caenarcaniphilales bacterium]|nr:transglutaminaseTgpA domain-containing protein [Candidatus Caenarcaniphilales bacterium]